MWMWMYPNWKNFWPRTSGSESLAEGNSWDLQDMKGERSALGFIYTADALSS